MCLLFETGIVGYLYLFSTLLLVGYLIYLSIVDIKLHQLEYWQTGLLFGFSIFNLILYIISETTYLNSVGAQTIPLWKYLIVHLSSALIVFIFLLILSFIKKNGKSGIGGADIWALTAVSLPIGIIYLPYLLIIMCATYLLFVLLYRIIRKEKIQRVAFLPFISIGTMSTITMLLF